MAPALLLHQLRQVCIPQGWRSKGHALHKPLRHLTAIELLQ